jgi:hypothetical protein
MLDCYYVFRGLPEGIANKVHRVPGDAGWSRSIREDDGKNPVAHARLSMPIDLVRKPSRQPRRTVFHLHYVLNSNGLFGAVVFGMDSPRAEIRQLRLDVHGIESGAGPQCDTAWVAKEVAILTWLDIGLARYRLGSISARACRTWSGSRESRGKLGTSSTRIVDWCPDRSDASCSMEEKGNNNCRSLRPLPLLRDDISFVGAGRTWRCERCAGVRSARSADPTPVDAGLRFIAPRCRSG